MPKPLLWKKIKTNGDIPDERIGHTLIKIDRNYILFGGLEMNEDRLKLKPTNSVYTLKLSSNNIKWKLNTVQGDIPLPRCHHSACEISKGEMLIFGGYHTSNRRFNDSYILKTNKNYLWEQPPNQRSGHEPMNTESKIGAPSPRANHTSTYIKNKNVVLFFGGHGGLGYSRKAFNDLHSLDCESFEWKKIDSHGSPPEPRGGHISGLLPNGQDIFVQGGWSCFSQFSNLYIYEFEKNNWIEVDLNLDTPRWNHSGIVVSALPEWKLFIFGGSSAYFEEGTPRNFGKFKNSILYLDLCKNMDNSKVKTLELENEEVVPKARENSTMIYDQADQKLLIFGGWSNNLLEDIYSLNVSAITGPEYAIYDIEPKLGPLTGKTSCIIKGEGFKSTQTFYVQFGTEKNHQNVAGIFVSEKEIRCETPNFEESGPQEVEVKIWTDRGDLTITYTKFKYFLNTKAEKTIAFGPGLLLGNSIKDKTEFFIQTRNLNNENRLSGKDEFKIVIKKKKQETEESEENKEALEKIKEEEIEGVSEEKLNENENKEVKEGLEYKIEDYDDGHYKISFEVEEKGEYDISIKFKDENNEFQPIRGSPYQANFTEENHKNEFTGPVVRNHINTRIAEIDHFIKKTKKGINFNNSNYEENRFDLLKIKENIQELENKNEKTMLDLDVINQILQYLEIMNIPMKKELDTTKNLIRNFRSLNKASLDVKDTIKDNIKSESVECNKEIENFENKLKYYYFDIKQKEVYKYETGKKNAFVIIKSFEEELKVFENELCDFDYFAKMFEFPKKTEKAHSNIKMIKNEINLVKKLWTHIKKTQDYFAESLLKKWKDIDPIEMQDDVKKLNRDLTQIKGVDRKSNVYQGISKEIRNWMQFLPIIEELNKDAMVVPDDRHWKKFKEILNKEFEVNGEMKLETLWNFKIFSNEYKEQIEELTEKAGQEKKIETDLKKIKDLWDDIFFLNSKLELKDGTFTILKMDDEHVELLDDHQLLIQSITSNKYLAYYEKEAFKWQKGLSNVNETIRLLSEVQKTWSFLINLFIYSEEVKKELPNESQEFEKIDKKVKKILKNGQTTNNIFEFCNQTLDGKFIMTILEEIFNDLNTCQKGLNDFIAKKRKVFPRFYFLTMEELLDILANGNNPLMLFKEKNYMNKIVQAGDKLEMEEIENQRPKIISLTSSVGIEKIKFVNEGIQLKGKVENYLQDVLNIVHETIHEKAKKSMELFKKMDRKEWIDQNFAQLNLLINSVYWVKEVEQKFLDLQDGNLDALKTFLDLSKGKLTKLIEYVQGDLSKALRKKLMCLITIDTHNRDVVEKLIKEDVRKEEEFHWQSQLKFYWNDKTDEAYSRIADASFIYGYEYLGNGSRLVITPLTDRIYVTATQALHLKMGCAPAGPAGTGKTETTKDLAAALGIACYVFNCSGEMNYETMGNIFKGLASSGCWGCFDEFNRLIPEVLSVCTVQFKAVTDAIKMNKTEFYMEDDLVHLNPSCGAFITMNPGYLGRAELPEGLKALFRPITVVVPDLELICENILMAEGFVHAKNLARKFVTLYKLCKSLLSDQDHYDWGLRAIKSVLVVAGTFKRAESHLSEESLLFRALRDFNYPKIAEVDFGIFNGLLGDLFPRIEIERKVNKEFETIIKEVTVEKNLTPDPDFILKVVQLSELLEIRHCVFLMGPPGAGKTTTWKVLADSIEKTGKKITVQDMDPKVVSTRDLYGYTNMTTKEWKNGLLSHYMQTFSEQLTDGGPKWIVLDGDLDANWIESMNSVMDDNRLLTLANNGRIILKNYMKMLFEIKNLKFATPATVSRAGILYISDDKGYQRKCYIQSWLRKFEKEYNTDVEFLTMLFEKYVEKIVDFLLKNCKFVVPISFFSMTTVLCKMLGALIKENFDKIVQSKDSKTGVAVLDNQKMESFFTMCSIWAFGGCLTEKDKKDYRKDFSSFWKNEFKTIRFPSKGTVFDYFVNIKDNKAEMEEWKAIVDQIEYDPSIPMKSITVPIPETVSLQTLSKYLIFEGSPILYIGQAGSGKTQLIKGLLSDIRKSLPEQYYYSTINFNYYTDSDYLQNMMENELIKQGNRYGPKKGNKIKLIYFIDDLNMPQLDAYQTQTAIALLRQHIDYSHWYDISKAVPVLKEVINTQVIAAMNPTSGSFHVNPRYQRHFWTVAVNNLEQSSQIMIYETFLKGHFRKFKSIIQDMTVPLIKAAIQLHEKVQSSFRKTAINFHYEFTIRHLSSIFEGLLFSQPSQFHDQEKIIKLWIHESERVYSDRLVSTEHINLYKQNAFEVLKKNFSKFSLQKFFVGANPETLLFTNFPKGYQNEHIYDLVSFENTEKHVLEALRDYNENLVEMNLVLFDDAIKHVCRIARIVSSPSGHALLVGVGGSGKQSLTKLAAFICELTPFSITVSANYNLNNLKEDLLELYKKTGIKDEGILFLINEGHITKERFLVYINDLLSSGEVADLYTEEDKLNIINGIRAKVKSAGKSDTPDECWQFYIDKVRKNLHVTLCFSPMGDTFRTRARRFPALVNCTVIDWFQPWPKDALTNVAQEFLKDVDLGDESVRKSVVEFMPFSFEIANKAAQDCFMKERRYVYTTPKSFLELLNLFKIMLEKKRIELEGERDIYELGLDKLEQTEMKVCELQEDLKIIQVDVEKKKDEADKVAEIVGIEKAKVEEESKKAKLEEEQCSEIKKNVELQKQTCESDVKKLKPLVKNALDNLDSLNVKEIQMLKAMPQPPKGVEKVFFCIMYMFAGVPGYDNDIELNNKKLPKNLDWKNGCLKIMKEPQKLIEKLCKFNKEIKENKVPPQNFAKIKPFFEEDLFKNPELMSKKSSSAGFILMFITCMVQYYDAMTLMIPKRQALIDANNQLETANTKLHKVKEEVKTLEQDLAVLVEKYNKATAEKNSAIAEADRCGLKLSLAQRLVSALSSEKGRWGESIEKMSSQINHIVGDVLLAAGFISYSGPFTKNFRDYIINDEFETYIKKKQIPKSKNLNPVQLLVDDATKAEWNNQGLPSDPVSIENGVILTNSERYPLIIDPQLQGIGWILEKEKVNNIKVMRIGSKNYIFELERAIENGVPVLLENLDDSIDPMVMPVIARKTFKRLGKKYLKFSGKDLLINENFKLYLQTKLSNPHYPPEVQAEAALINFTVTEEGLGDQLLSLVVSKERPDLAEKKNELIQQQNEFKIKLKELEKGLLDRLKNLKENFLEDIDLINNLESSQKFSIDIRDKVEIAKVTEVKINKASEFYRPAAIRGALIFFVMNELYKMDSFYMYSLESFLVVICRAIKIVADKYKSIEEEEEKKKKEKNSENQEDDDGEEKEEDDVKKEEDEAELEEKVKKRVEELCESITYQSFGYVQKGLFVKHKIIFSTLLCLRILEKSKVLESEEVKHLIQGKNLTNYPNMPETVKGYLTEQIWKDCKSFDYIEELKDLCENFDHDHLHWRKWFSEEKVEEIDLPKKYKEVTEFHKLMVIKVMRPDRVSSALRLFVSKYMGTKYIEQEPFSMEETFKETSSGTPIFFVLFPGVDPTKEVEEIGLKKGKTLIDSTLFNISMGQGQEERAMHLLRECAKKGHWIFLQNVHLMQSWLKIFERGLEEVIKTAHDEFRVFISSEQAPTPESKIIPESILQKCIKISNEAPQDLKANMLRALSHFSEKNVSKSSKPNEYKSILFSLCYFHSVILGRKKFGAQGWASVYNFNDGDLRICADVLHNYLEKYEVVPYEDLKYIYGDIMYGGHITDDWDRRTNRTYLKVFIKPELLNSMNLVPGQSPIYRILDPNKNNYEDYVKYVNKLPKESPLMFGMHSNAEINYLTNQCDTIFRMIIDIQGGSSGSGNQEEESVKDIVKKYQELLPKSFDLIRIKEKIQEKEEEIPSPYDIVCAQECEKMNCLLLEILTSLEELHMGLDGALNMSDSMETLSISLILNRVPGNWGIYYASKKNLASWFNDLKSRCYQLKEWSENLILPKSICLSYLFNPMSFLTAIMQLTARSKLLPLDNMILETIVTSITDPNQISNPPNEGAYIHGLFLEGASWEGGDNDGYLVDQKLKELHPVLPLINVVAIEIDKKDFTGKYVCPVYYTTQRGPTYVFDADLKMESYDSDDSKWILAGVAAILNDDY